MTKRGLSQEEMDELQNLHARAEHAMRRLVEYMRDKGLTKYYNDVSQVVTAKAMSDDGRAGVWVVRAVIPTSTGEITTKTRAHNTKLDPDHGN